jgi:hypothetical protein
MGKVFQESDMSNKSSVNPTSRYAPTLSVHTEKSSENLDLAAIPFNVPSLCIPRVFANISKERVDAVFRKLDIGKVERIDMIERTDDKGQTWKRVFVHLQWNDSELSRSARERLLCGNDVKVVYEDPWFWKVSANRSTRETQVRDAPRPRNDGPRNDGPRNNESRPRDSRARDFRPRDSRPPRDTQIPRAQVPPLRNPSEETDDGGYQPRSPSNSPPRDATHHVEV